MRWTFAAVVVPFLLLAGCTGRGSGEAVDDQMTAPSGSKPAHASARSVQLLTGRLGFDDVEGGCAYLERDDGTRFEVLYPEGWQLDRGAGVLVGPGGQRVAAGDRLSVRGSIATDRSSICQLGPIFEASEVVTGLK